MISSVNSFIIISNISTRKNNQSFFIIIMFFNIIKASRHFNMITICISMSLITFHHNIITPKLKKFIFNTISIFNKMINLINSITRKINFTIKCCKSINHIVDNICINSSKQIIFKIAKSMPSKTFTTLETKPNRFKHIILSISSNNTTKTINLILTIHTTDFFPNITIIRFSKHWK